MLIVGFSTGALALGDFALGLQLLNSTRANAVELSALRSNELSKLISALPDLIEGLRKRYNYISFHAPTDFKDERETVSQLCRIAEMGLNIIVHPDTIRDVSLWRKLESRVCIENMDTRKAAGRTAKELRQFFIELPEARFCFDIAHARQVDPTMTETYRILTSFGERLAQVHVSEVDGAGKHFPMSYGAKHAFAKFSRMISGVPIIIESIVVKNAIQHEIDEAWRVFSATRYESLSKATVVEPNMCPV